MKNSLTGRLITEQDKLSINLDVDSKNSNKKPVNFSLIWDAENKSPNKCAATANDGSFRVQNIWPFKVYYLLQLFLQALTEWYCQYPCENHDSGHGRHIMAMVWTFETPFILVRALTWRTRLMTPILINKFIVVSMPRFHLSPQSLNLCY